jgi:hypothetical protein
MNMLFFVHPATLTTFGVRGPLLREGVGQNSALSGRPAGPGCRFNGHRKFWIIAPLNFAIISCLLGCRYCRPPPIGLVSEYGLTPV